MSNICSTFREFYRTSRESMDAVLLDADGTLTLEGLPLSGADELLEMLKKDDFPFLILTNDTSHSPAEKCAVLKKAGLSVPEEKIFSAAFLLKEWKDSGLFFQCGELGNPNHAQAAGLQITRDPSRLPECAGILMGEGSYDWPHVWEEVFNELFSHPEKPFLVPNPDSCSAAGNGRMVLNSGGQARYLCQVLKDAGKNVEPVYLGKPYPPIFRGALDQLLRQYPALAPLRKERIVLLGDSLRSDICGGNRTGLCTALVLTGVTTGEMARNAEGEFRASMVFRSV